MAVKFEDKLKKLEDIVQTLEEGPDDLEEALKTFEAGIKLSRQCHQDLEKAQSRVEVLLKDNKGDLEEHKLNG